MTSISSLSPENALFVRILQTGGCVRQSFQMVCFRAKKMFYLNCPVHKIPLSPTPFNDFQLYPFTIIYTDFTSELCSVKAVAVMADLNT